MTALRHAYRSLSRAPGFSLAAILTIATGIGSALTVFAVANALILRGLPYPDANRLFVLWEKSPSGNETRAANPVTFFAWMDRSRSIDKLAAYIEVPANLGGESTEPEQVKRLRVTGAYFDVLGMRPLMGRAFTEEEMSPGAPQNALISYALWQSRYGGAADILGRTVTLDWIPCKIIGVMPREFHSPLAQASMWTQLDLVRGRMVRGRYIRVIGRLRGDATQASLASDLEPVSAALALERPDHNRGWTATASPLARESSRAAREPIGMLSIAVALMLALVCANVAGLLLVRGSGREAEMAVRKAMGATRWMIAGQATVESLLLAAAGGLAGLAIAVWAAQPLLDLLPLALRPPHLDAIEIDFRVAVAAIAIVAFTGLAAGVIPAIRAARTAESLRSRNSLSPAMVSLQVAFALVLATGAVTMTRTLIETLSANPGFEREHVMAATLMLGSNDPKRAAMVPRTAEAIAERVRAVPGVAAAGTAHWLPLEGATRTAFHVDGSAPPDVANRPQADFTIVSRGYFATLGIPILGGRTFDERDGAAAPNAVIINQALARQWFPNADPIGRRLVITPSSKPGPFEIIGVAGDIRSASLAEPQGPAVYLHQLQQTWGIAQLAVRPHPGIGNIVPSIRSAVREIDPNLPLADVRRLADIVSQSTGATRVQTWLISFFSVIAVLLSATGLFATLALMVRQRRREFGIRSAVGAAPEDLVRFVRGRGIRIMAPGLAIGAVTALAAGFGPTAIAAACGVLTLASCAALYPPARWAARVDPVIALRSE